MPSAETQPPTIQELTDLGRRLYGSRAWQTRMAAALGVEDSTVSRWARGQRAIPPTAIGMLRLLDARRKTTRALKKAIGA